MRDADQNSRNDIRDIENRPKTEMDEIDNALAANAVEQVAAAAERRAQRRRRDGELSNRLMRE
jgi:hypothetical protein